MLTKIADRNQLLAFLKNDPFLHLYSIGDLDDFFWERTTWFAWVEEDVIQALFLLYKGDHATPTLLALEEERPQAAAALLENLRHLLPDRFYGHSSVHLLPCIGEWYATEFSAPHLKMRLEPGYFSPVGQRKNLPIVSLQPADLDRVLTLYREAYPGNWFDARMLETGQYLGFEKDRRLIAAAGIHVYSPQYRVAALGNITTHPDFRGKGISTLLTSALCRQLFETVDRIGLNVAQSNLAAIRCYSKIGFVEHCRYEEVLIKGRV